jgi:SAM-dependent methyltransferase
MTDRPRESLPPAYFDAVYAARADPWDFETSPYEAAKYDATLAALPRARYASLLEIGCSIGVLTRRLAGRCDRLLALDVAPAALERARARCADLPHVRFERRRVPDELPDGRFDAIVVSEVGYYWSAEDLRRARDLLLARLESAGHLLLVHWTPPVHDYPLTGDEVHAAFLESVAAGALRHLGGGREATYRLDVFERR